jgi:hypothetical protein
MKTKFHLVAIFGLSIFTNVLFSQKYFVDASYANGALSSKKLNGQFVKTESPENFPISVPEGLESSVSDTWHAIQGKFGMALKRRLVWGLHTSYTKHQYTFRYATSTKSLETTFFSNHHIEISKLSIGTDLTLAWKYFDLSLIFGVAINGQNFHKGMTKSSEHFKILDLKNQKVGGTINTNIGVGLSLKYPIYANHAIIGGLQIIGQLPNKIVKDYYQVSYITVALQVGYRYYFLAQN